MKKFFGFCLVFLLFGAAYGFSQIGTALGLPGNITTYRCTGLKSSPTNADTAPDQSGTVQSVSVQNTTNGLYVQINYKNGTTESLTLIMSGAKRGDEYTSFYDVSHINSQPASNLFAEVLKGYMGEIHTISINNSPVLFEERIGFYHTGSTLIKIGLQPW